jgi:pilus assembly protein Flp/PilA
MREANDGKASMNTFFLGLIVQFRNLVSCEEGQDLVEYALILAIIALGATASMQSLSAMISALYIALSTTFAKAL